MVIFLRKSSLCISLGSHKSNVPPSVPRAYAYSGFITKYHCPGKPHISQPYPCFLLFSYLCCVFAYFLLCNVFCPDVFTYSWTNCNICVYNLLIVLNWSKLSFAIHISFTLMKVKWRSEGIFLSNVSTLVLLDSYFLSITQVNGSWKSSGSLVQTKSQYIQQRNAVFLHILGRTFFSCVVFGVLHFTSSKLWLVFADKNFIYVALSCSFGECSGLNLHSQVCAGSFRNINYKIIQYFILLLDLIQTKMHH